RLADRRAISYPACHSKLAELHAMKDGLPQFFRVYVSTLLAAAAVVAAPLAAFTVVPAYRAQSSELSALAAVYSALLLGFIFSGRTFVREALKARRARRGKYRRWRIGRQLLFMLPILLGSISLRVFLSYRECLADSVLVSYAEDVAASHSDTSSVAREALRQLRLRPDRQGQVEAASFFLSAWFNSDRVNASRILLDCRGPIPFASGLLVRYILFLAALQTAFGVLATRESIQRVLT